MKVAIISETPLWEEHHAQVFELALREIRLGNKVFIFQCRGALASCPANSKHSLALCVLCSHVSMRTRKLLKSKGVVFSWLKYAALEETSLPLSRVGPEMSIEDAMQIRYKNFAIGRRVVSQMLSDMRDLPPVLADLHYEFSEKVRDGCSLYEECISAFSDLKIEKIWTWNGRRYPDAAFAQAGIDLGLKVNYFISGSTIERILTSESPIHSTGPLEDFASEITVSKSLEEIKTYATIWADSRRYGGSKIPGDRHFAAQFTKDTFKAISDKPILSIFTSSVWENHSTDITDPNRVGVSADLIHQYQTLPRVLEETHQNYEVVVRWHPHLQDAGPHEVQAMSDIIKSSPRVRHVLPESEVDSYEIVSQSDVVLVFGSSIGAEAAMMGKRVVLLGPSAYENLGFAETPQNLQVFLSSLDAPMQSTSVSGAYVYGAFQVLNGEPLREVQISLDRSNFSYQGQSIVPMFKLIRKLNPSRRFKV